MATVPYIGPRHPTTTNPFSSPLNTIWGDGYGNRVGRFLGCVAHLDGQRPSRIMSRGYYGGRTAIAAWDWRNGQLTMRWLFDTYGNPSLASYNGQGNHQLSIADVDSDGRDEVVFGSRSVDDDCTGLYSTGLAHGDALHVTDFDPNRPGLEVFAPHESPGDNGGIGASFRSAATGAMLWSTPATSDVGRGTIMDIDPRFDGAEGWASRSGKIYVMDGSVASPSDGASTNFGIWWEDGPLRQLLNGTTIGRWNWANGRGRTDILNAADQGAAQSNGTKATPALSGDIASFQIIGPVTLADTTLEMDLPLSGQTSDSIAITGGLTLTGINQLVPILLANLLLQLRPVTQHVDEFQCHAWFHDHALATVGEKGPAAFLVVLAASPVLTVDVSPVVSAR